MNRVRFALGVATVVAGGIAMTPVVAAHAALSDCPSNQVCVWVNQNYDTLMGYRAPGLGLMNVSAGNNDRMTSWANNSTTPARWYVDADGKGACLSMANGARVANVGSTYNDKMSSWATNRAC